MRTFAELIRDEIGESANPISYEEVLRKNDHELLEWLSGQCNEAQRLITESVQYAGVEDRRGTLHFGMRILESDLRSMLFAVRELKARAEAVAV